MAKRRGKGGTTTTRDRLKQAAVVVVALAALAFAVQGGEYGTTDLLHQKQRRAKLLTSIDSLQHTVDSLKRYKHRLQTDPALQERIAREEFGMVRGDRELLYRFAEPDTNRDSVPR
jgi:cell division protein FtsB